MEILLKKKFLLKKKEGISDVNKSYIDRHVSDWSQRLLRSLFIDLSRNPMNERYLLIIQRIARSLFPSF